MTDTPIASDVSTMNIPTPEEIPSPQEIEEAQRNVAAEIIEEGKEILSAVSDLFYKSALLALSLRDESILRPVVATITNQVSRMGSEYTWHVTEGLKAFSELTSDTKEKNSGSTETPVPSASSETISSKEANTSASPKERLIL